MMLQVTGLTKIFGGLRAVDNASLGVDEGRLVALIGPNGAGKTTLFACIAGFLPLNAGRVEFLGRDITGLPVHEIARAGMVRTFQITQPFAKLTVHENIAVGAYQKFSDRARAWAHAQAIAEQVGMAHMLAQPASELTVAGRKRLELARAGHFRKRLPVFFRVPTPSSTRGDNDRNRAESCGGGRHNIGRCNSPHPLQ